MSANAAPKGMDTGATVQVLGLINNFTMDKNKPDPVNHPPHYKAHPSGVECIQITEHMGFNLGNAIKYIWRADLKGNSIEDLRKAAWYVLREIERREKQ